MGPGYQFIKRRINVFRSIIDHILKLDKKCGCDTFANNNIYLKVYISIIFFFLFSNIDHFFRTSI